jgi:hypothetical protein
LVQNHHWSPRNTVFTPHYTKPHQDHKPGASTLVKASNAALQEGGGTRMSSLPNPRGSIFPPKDPGQRCRKKEGSTTTPPSSKLKKLKPKTISYKKCSHLKMFSSKKCLNFKKIQI